MHNCVRRSFTSAACPGTHTGSLSAKGISRTIFSRFSQNPNFVSVNFNVWFTFSSWVLVETFGEIRTIRSMHKCRHSHSRARIIDNEARHSRHSRFLWLGTDLPTYLRELWDETRIGWEFGRRDKCILHILVLILSRAVSTRMWTSTLVLCQLKGSAELSLVVFLKIRFLSVWTLMPRLHSHLGYLLRLLVRCERYEVCMNVDIHTIVQESLITRQDIRDVLVSFDSELIYRHISENFEMRQEQVESLEDETNVPFTLSFSYCLVPSPRECEPGIKCYTSTNLAARRVQKVLNDLSQVVFFDPLYLNQKRPSRSSSPFG